MNHDKQPLLCYSSIVLIDTWWNVNSETIEPNIFAIFVLIDTWWNVNNPVELCNYHHPSFNRYMVECELLLSHFVLKSRFWF